MAQTLGADLPPWIHALSGSVSVVAANSLLYPIDQVRVKLQNQSKQDAKKVPEHEYYHSSFDAAVKILRTEGIGGLYVGLPGNLIAGAAQGFVFNYWHSTLRKMYLSSILSSQPPGTTAELVISYGASALTAMFTLPLTTVTTRQQTTPKAERKGLVATGQEIVKTEGGLQGLWKGLNATLILCVNLAITYGAAERLRTILYQGRTKLTPTESFTLGALSKALATVVTHPIVVAKVALVAKPPAARLGKPFKSFGEVLSHIVETEGFLRLWKGLAPSLSKAVLFQGLLMIFKERSRVQLGLIYYFLQAKRLQSRVEIKANALPLKTRPLV